MNLNHIGVIGRELALKFDDGREIFLPFDLLRRHCPCAACQEHANPTTHDGGRATSLANIQQVGSYAVLLTWQDGHATGIYSYEYLLHLSDLLA